MKIEIRERERERKGGYNRRRRVGGLPVGSVALGIDFYCRKERRRRVQLAGAAGDPFSLSLFKERTERESSKDQSNKCKYKSHD